MEGYQFREELGRTKKTSFLDGELNTPTLKSRLKQNITSFSILDHNEASCKKIIHGLAPLVWHEYTKDALWKDAHDPISSIVTH